MAAIEEFWKEYGPSAGTDGTPSTNKQLAAATTGMADGEEEGASLSPDELVILVNEDEGDEPTRPASLSPEELAILANEDEGGEDRDEGDEATWRVSLSPDELVIPVNEHEGIPTPSGTDPDAVHRLSCESPGAAGVAGVAGNASGDDIGANSGMQEEREEGRGTEERQRLADTEARPGEEEGQVWYALLSVFIVIVAVWYQTVS
ncbi:hypothetical protein GE09DRAFT_1220412 [Coniochaeta sp. 2T2.1]|nr:hypothetical protein GE09DRAFT_1220412 [Coniochaeta sp. 2T2.1]